MLTSRTSWHFSRSEKKSLGHNCNVESENSEKSEIVHILQTAVFPNFMNTTGYHYEYTFLEKVDVITNPRALLYDPDILPEARTD